MDRKSSPNLVEVTKPKIPAGKSFLFGKPESNVNTIKFSDKSKPNQIKGKAIPALAKKLYREILSATKRDSVIRK